MHNRCYRKSRTHRFPGVLQHDSDQFAPHCQDQMCNARPMSLRLHKLLDLLLLHQEALLGQNELLVHSYQVGAEDWHHRLHHLLDSVEARQLGRAVPVPRTRRRRNPLGCLPNCLSDPHPSPGRRSFPSLWYLLYAHLLLQQG